MIAPGMLLRRSDGTQVRVVAVDGLYAWLVDSSTERHYTETVNFLERNYAPWVEVRP